MIARKFSVLLDDETRAGVDAYATSNQMTNSQAVRVLLSLALKDENATADAAFRAAVFREGVTMGLSRVRERFNESMHDVAQKALGDLERVK